MKKTVHKRITYDLFGDLLIKCDEKIGVTHKSYQEIINDSLRLFFGIGDKVK